MEPVRESVRNVLDVIEETERVLYIASFEKKLAIRLRHQLYLDTLKAIASRSQDEFSRDMATEVLHLESIGEL